jgi:Tfp pilus assembly protein PilO
MASTLEIVLTEDRADIHRKIDSLEDGWRVKLTRPKRSLPQNAKMWAMLTDVSQQVIYYGKRYSTFQWKDIFSASLHEYDTVPTLDGHGLVILGLRTSEMEDAEMAALIELMEAFGAQEGVRFRAPEWYHEMAQKQRTAKAKP